MNSFDRLGKRLHLRHGFREQIQSFFSTNYIVQREELGALVSLEMGKIRTEGVGEVQEFVDIVSTFSSSSRSDQVKCHWPSILVRLCRRFVENDEW